MRAFGTVILVFAIIGLIASLGMDTSVGTSFGRVNNLGLMAERQNYVTVSCVALIVAILMIVFGGRQGGSNSNIPVSPANVVPTPDPTRKCPFCAEVIKAEAIKCRFCASTIVPIPRGEGDMPLRDVEEGETGSQHFTTTGERSTSEKIIPLVFLGIIVAVIAIAVMGA